VGGLDDGAWHGADVAYFVNLLVAALLYAGYQVLRIRNP
jgi:NCS1 family nucleobase:cation symporter-1